MVEKELVVTGKRKTSVAKVRIKKGTGQVLINNIPYANLPTLRKLSISEPIKISENFLGDFNFDISINTIGGGKESQIQAARLGIARAVIKFTENLELREAFVKYDRHLLVADTRRKEQYKPGDSKARAKRQSSKR
ncbi:TPA: 30S ribosomal protein S9 [Candidatus Pacearchaeota archaeon]|jgi:small subunit ribosomal protein S9|nr:30S ribosomal protein S9 [Candidatus Pacearchaeota archaeon]